MAMGRWQMEATAPESRNTVQYKKEKKVVDLWANINDNVYRRFEKKGENE